jgi:hypothetical protein
MSAGGGESVGELAELYLGNLLYALELAAHALDGEGKGDAAGFYRGIARRLAEARGRAVRMGGEGVGEGDPPT